MQGVDILEMGLESLCDFIMYQDVVSFKVCILPFLSMSVPPMFFLKEIISSFGYIVNPAAG